MKLNYLILTLAVVYLAAADPQCPPTNDPENVIHYPHPTDCGKFLTCDWGKLVEQKCPEGQFWNDNKKYCDYPENVNCGGLPPSTSAPHTTTPTKTTTVVPPSSAPPVTDKCPEVYDPYNQVYFPHEDCSKYYICTYEGNKLEQNCPPNLHWSQQLGYCDRPEVAKCHQANNVDGCPAGFDPEHPVFYPHADCTRYYVCINGQKVEQQCPSGLHWNTNRNYCDLVEHSACEGPSSLATESPSVSSTPSTSKPVCPSQSAHGLVFLPHEDCTKYYVCDHGLPVEMNCAFGTFWNSLATVCDSASEYTCTRR